MADNDERPQDSAKAKADAIALAEQAEAEAAEAEALAAAARARARAIKLRRAAQAQAEGEGEGEGEGEAQATTAVTEAAEASAEASQPPQTVEATETPEPFESPAAPRRLLAPKLSRTLSVAAIVAICGLLGVSGWMMWQHRDVVRERQQSAAFTAAAKQGVINLTSLDFNKAKEDVQRVLDSSTGEFKDDFQRRADDFASVVQDSKAVTEGSVTATAVESMSKDSAVVLVLANERITNSTGAKNEPRSFRFRVSVAREDDQMKISKVEFVL